MRVSTRAARRTGKSPKSRILLSTNVARGEGSAGAPAFSREQGVVVLRPASFARQRPASPAQGTERSALPCAECEHPPGRLNRRRARRTHSRASTKPGLSAALPRAVCSLRRTRSYHPAGRPDAPAMPPCSVDRFHFPVDDAARTARFAGTSMSGASRDRTGDLLLAKQALSQLSYGPVTGRV